MPFLHFCKFWVCCDKTYGGVIFAHITVTLFARFLGLSGSNPRHKDAVSASDCKGITDKTGNNKSSLIRGSS